MELAIQFDECDGYIVDEVVFTCILVFRLSQGSV